VATPVGVKFQGLESTLQRIARARATAPNTFARGVREQLQIVLLEAVREVPKLTGALASTGRVEEASIGGHRTEFIILFGGPSKLGTYVNYAMPVHEDLLAAHPRGGKAKYLEDPINRHKRTFAQNVSARMGRVYKP